MDGKLQERSKSINGSTVMIIMSFFVLTAGIIIGSVYLMHVASDSDAMLGNYLNSFFVTGANGINKSAAFKNALRENAVYFLIIFIAGFFRIGIQKTRPAKAGRVCCSIFRKINNRVSCSYEQLQTSASA